MFKASLFRRMELGLLVVRTTILFGFGMSLPVKSYGQIEEISQFFIPHIFRPMEARSFGSAMNGVIDIWDTVTGTRLHSLDGHSGTVNSVKYSPDGLKIASGSGDDTVRIWRKTASGNWVPDESPPCSIAPLAASLMFDGEMPTHFWTTDTQQLCGLPVQEGTDLIRHELRAELSAAAYLTMDKFAQMPRALAGFGDGTVDLIDLDTGNTLTTYRGHGGPITHIEVVGTRAAIGAADGSVQVIDLPKAGAPVLARAAHVSRSAAASTLAARASLMDMIAPKVESEETPAFDASEQRMVEIEPAPGRG